MVAGARRKEEPMRSTAVQGRGHRLNIHAKLAEATELDLGRPTDTCSPADGLGRDIQADSFFGTARENMAVADRWRGPAFAIDRVSAGQFGVT